MTQEHKMTDKLSEFEITRMDNDLAIAFRLFRDLGDNNFITLLDGGYGIDSVCKGRLTRFHHDLDLIVLKKGPDIDELRNTVVNSIGEAGWTENQTTPGWLWYTKDDLDLPGLSRQINIHSIELVDIDFPTGLLRVSSRKGKEYQLEITRSQILDASYSRYEFLTLAPEEYAAAKLRLIPVYAPDWRIRESDQHDLSLLFQNPGYDIEKCASILKSYYYAFVNSSQDNTDNSPSSTPNELFTQLMMTYPSVLSEVQITYVKNLSGI